MRQIFDSPDKTSRVVLVYGVALHILAPMNPLSPTERRALRAKAHHLEPVVTVGHHGLTPAVQHEIDLALLAHDLVKVRVLGDDRAAREAMLAQACEVLDCAAVQHVGKVLVLWRPNPERKKKSPKTAEPAKPARKPARKRTGPRPPVDPVRERRRAAKTTEIDPTSDQARRRRRTV
jgi:putative YhbY family RNA-binding protein